MTTSNYPNLAEFLGSYFHQDWALDAASSGDVTKSYATEWPRTEALATLQEIELLLRSQSENSVSQAVRGMGCYFVPASEGFQSFSSWLRSVEMNLKSLLNAT